MQSDHWGPVPVALAQAVDKTPNHPDGDPACYDVSFRFGGESFQLPVLTWEEATAVYEIDPDVPIRDQGSEKCSAGNLPARSGTRKSSGARCAP